ncbi:PH domain-containing protein [Pyxidicoccus fallax]|uniref:PH domain-containing protein n=1 Tax=Pyxidicoccus fallax TaxID=394095 RepID=A0A848LC07_9BACT|nr:PH domain-containing protein [Pyxidicoccus fallax]NMO16014.1 PH domain-containing protein [Pyxidicoccus fallax]NPC76973.1 PH domain-containing protein [Pyxidicoccus fallax]
MTDTRLPSPTTEVAFLSRLPTVLRPHRNLLTYYVLTSLMAGPGFPIVLLVLFFRFQTLRYELDAEGITVRWGILFRREVSLTYARIQDIHLSSNVVERWLGLAKVQVQTASGNAQAEITIEGIQAFEAMRDFLYSKMRGSRDRPAAARTPLSGGEDALAATLREVAAEVRALRLGLDAGVSAPAPEKKDD